MAAYIAQRLLHGAFVILGVTCIVFGLNTAAWTSNASRDRTDVDVF